jgi:cell division protein FtsI/penicillin-binding protein 2
VVGVGARPSLGALSGTDVAMTRRAARLRPVLLGSWTVVCCMLVVVVVLPPVPAPPAQSAPPVASRGDLLSRDGTVLARTVTIGATPTRTYTPDTTVVSTLDADVTARLGCDPTWVQRLIDAQCNPTRVVSTIAPGVQATMQEALTGVVGDAVAVDSTSGDILGMWSSDVGTPGVRGGDGLPAETYASAPGSSFKTITAAAVLTAGVDSTTPMRNEYTPPGGQAKIHNAGIQTLGGTLEAALAASSNTSFAELATRVGGPAIAAAASDLTSWPETAGTAHGPAVDVGHELTNPDALARTGFGQQDVRATPLDMAVVAATIAAGGRRPTPRLMTGTCVANSYVADPVPAAPMVLTEAVAGRIADGMTLSVTRGAAPALADLQGPVAAKTGTADDGTGNYDGWVIAYAPVGNTKVAVAVRVMADVSNGNSRTGAQDAAPVAAKVLLAVGSALAHDVDPCVHAGNGE